MSKARMIMISDAHVSRNHRNADRFFAMLRALESFDGDIVFLGDIFDLWIGWKRYQESDHDRFLNWCREQKAVRSLGFIEGNHEFYICRHFSDYFSWCSRDYVQQESLRLEHGDLMNPRDRNYLAFRRVSNHLLASCFFRVLPWGPTLVQYLKKKLKTTNMAYRKNMPKEAIEAYAGTIFSNSAEHETDECPQAIVFGHFHTHQRWAHPSGRTLISLPAWLNGEEISIFENGELIQVGPWEELLSSGEPASSTGPD